MPRKKTNTIAHTVLANNDQTVAIRNAVTARLEERLFSAAAKGLKLRRATEDEGIRQFSTLQVQQLADHIRKELSNG